MSIYIPPGYKRSDYFKLLKKYNDRLERSGFEDIELMTSSGEISELFRPTSTSLGRSSNSSLPSNHESVLEYYSEFAQFAQSIRFRFDCIRHYTTRSAPFRHFSMILTCYLDGHTMLESYNMVKRKLRKKDKLLSYIFFAKCISKSSKQFLQYYHQKLKMDNAVSGI